MSQIPSDVTRAVEAVWRIESAKVTALLARGVGDVALAEDLAQDALVAALEQWPIQGLPANPGGWLVTVAKRRLIDRLRRTSVLESKQNEIFWQTLRRQDVAATDFEVVEEVIDDDLLRLVFVACHPDLSRDAQVALTLRLVAGLTTEEIARAFLVSEATISQRIVRAKRTLSQSRVAFELPSPDQITERLESVLEVIYLVFNEGYAATAGSTWTRPELCSEALRIARMLAELAPTEYEVHGLVALMEIQGSRLRARVGPAGEPVLLADQDRSRWDLLMIRRGLAALERSAKLGKGLGPYGLQAAIAACHAQARTLAETDWACVSALYDALAEIAPSPVVDLNRAVALAMAFGPEAGVDTLVREPTMEGSITSFRACTAIFWRNSDASRKPTGSSSAPHL
jgi:RNA polymerase sigma factor (sigma-70 family)